VLTPLQFTERAATRFADNEYQNITEKSFRDFADDIRNTFVAQVAVNVPDYEPGRYYAAGFLILYSVTNSFFSAVELGFLAAPDSPDGDSVWEPALSPVSTGLNYQVGTVGALQAARGNWSPGRLYILQGREDQTGAALDDVYVKALSAVQLEPTGYTIGKDSLAAEPQPVSYDLDTDTTSPVEVGAVDAYTKQEADALLAGKGSALVQQQHTQQLSTLGVQGSPVMVYKDDLRVNGYLTIDEALADNEEKTFQRFNIASLNMTKSNDPLKPGWAAYSNGEGCTYYVYSDVVLSLPGSNSDALRLTNFFFFQKPGTRGGRVELLTTTGAEKNDDDEYITKPAELPTLLNNTFAVPLRLRGGAINIEGGRYVSFQGSGVIHLSGNVSYGYVSPSIILVDHTKGTGGGGDGTSYTDAQAKQAATQLLLGAAASGIAITTDPGTGLLTFTNTVPSFGRLYFSHPAAGTGNLLRQTFEIEPEEAGSYQWKSDLNIAQVEYQGQGVVFNGTIADFRAAIFSQGSEQSYYVILTPIDVNKPTKLVMKRL
jgi:hypothetical protein